jgi:phospholipase C
MAFHGWIMNSYFSALFHQGPIVSSWQKSWRTIVLFAITCATLLTGCGSGTKAASSLAPTITLTADKTSITAGQTVTLSWSANRADSVSFNNGLGTLTGSGGSLKVTPTQTTTYTATATGSGGTATASVTITVGAVAQVGISLTANPININPGGASTLTWTSQNANTVVISPSIGQVATNGTVNVSPSQTTTYTATATGTDGSQQSASATVTIAPTLVFTATPNPVDEGGFVKLQWSASNATSLSCTPNLNDDDDGPNLAMSGTISFVALKPQTFVMTATGPGGTTSQTVAIQVNKKTPTITLTADKASILAGQTVTLSWSAHLADTVSFDNGLGTLTGSGGSLKVTPTQTTTYTATATGYGGTATASVTITVAAIAQVGVSLTANPININSGGASTLTWTSQNANTVVISPDIGPVATDGTVNVSPSQTTTYTATATGADGSQQSANVTVTVTASGNLKSVKHIIIFVQENRSFDNYFSQLGAYRVSKGLSNNIDAMDLNTSFTTYQGKHLKPFHQRTVVTELLTPAWNESHFFAHYSNGTFLMDNWMKQAKCSIPSSFGDDECTREVGYYDQTDIPYYYDIATDFATSDTFHSSALSGTLVNRSFLLAATSGGMNNPGNDFPVNAPTIFRLLTNAGISWRYYYQDNSVFLANFTKDWNDLKTNVYPIQNYFNLLALPTADQALPQVIFIEHAAQLALDEHTGNNIQLGVATAQDIIDAFLKSPVYSSSVFFLTHDEAGGEYDHVPPYPVPNPDGIPPSFAPGDIGQWDNFTYSGFRIPLLVISPWVKPHYVSHVNREFGSFLQFIETRFGLPSLTKRDAAADDMTEFFDFTQQSIPVPPTLNSQPTDGTVNCALEMHPDFTPSNAASKGGQPGQKGCVAGAGSASN